MVGLWMLWERGRENRGSVLLLTLEFSIIHAFVFMIICIILFRASSICNWPKSSRLYVLL